MDKGEFSSVLSRAYFKKFPSKINVPNSFKSLLTDSNVFFLWFEIEINRIPSSSIKAIA